MISARQPKAKALVPFGDETEPLAEGTRGSCFVAAGLLRTSGLGEEPFESGGTPAPTAMEAVSSTSEGRDTPSPKLAGPRSAGALMLVVMVVVVVVVVVVVYFSGPGSGGIADGGAESGIGVSAS